MPPARFVWSGAPTGKAGAQAPPITPCLAPLRPPLERAFASDRRQGASVLRARRGRLVRGSSIPSPTFSGSASSARTRARTGGFTSSYAAARDSTFLRTSTLSSGCCAGRVRLPSDARAPPLSPGAGVPSFHPLRRIGSRRSAMERLVPHRRPRFARLSANQRGEAAARRVQLPESRWANRRESADASELAPAE